MHEDLNAKLWFSTVNDGFFLIPDAAPLDDGDLELTNYFGTKRYVVQEQVEIYRVTREAAMAYIRIQVDTFFSKLSTRIAESLGDLDWSHAAEKLADIIAPIFSSNDKFGDDMSPLEIVTDDEEDSSTVH